MIDKTIVDAPLPMLPRRYVAAIPRVRSAADLVFAADRDEAATSPLGGAGSGGPGDIDLDRLNLQRTPAGWGEGGRAAVRGAPPARARLAPTSETARIVGEEPSRISPRRPIEKYLVAEVTRYEPALGQYGYCTIEIRRINEDLLPVLPKDIVLVQDSSASIAEQRLYFCREGWLKSLALIGPQDRFNVVAFRDRALRCFADWAPPTAENLEQARQFVAGMEARGNTDIYGSLRSLLEEKRDPRRPLIALVVSDGLPTVGETDSARIIEDFSQANRGQLSVFTCGTIGVANRYLLDLVSYRNRGDTYIVTSGRWDIPAAVENRMRSITRPVMSDMRFIFSAASRSEVYPALTANLYLDRPLILFCRYPVDSRFLVFQVTGTAGETACDMIFKLNLADAKAGTEDLKTRWAWQRAYALIGEHTRTRDPAILRELKRLSAAYRLTIPYQAEMREGDR
jgi:Ca-activated chloride channel family protein